MIRIRLLFACFIQLNGEGGYKDSVAYIPVELDFEREIMLIKAWTRQHIAHEEHKAENLLIHIKKLMCIEFKIKVKNFMSKHKKALFLMSKNLIDEVYSHVPAYNKIDYLVKGIKDFEIEMVNALPLKNVNEDEKGNYLLNKGVMNFEAEIRNILECLAISDYFYDKNFDEIWNLGLEAVVARVKFNDEEKVLTDFTKWRKYVSAYFLHKNIYGIKK